MTFFTTAEAADYCRFKTTGAIRKALKEHRLVSVGRRGGRGTHVFLREDLDRFMRGEKPRATEVAGRPRVPPSGGRDERSKVDQEMEQLDCAEAHEAARKAFRGVTSRFDDGTTRF